MEDVEPVEVDVLHHMDARGDEGDPEPRVARSQSIQKNSDADPDADVPVEVDNLVVKRAEDTMRLREVPVIDEKLNQLRRVLCHVA
jgi:hypothetical protein